MHSPPSEIGWEFERIERGSEDSHPVRFTTTGNYSFDLSREVARSISGFVLLPEDREKIDLSADQIQAYLILDGVRHPMSRFVFVEDVQQKGVVLHPETQARADLTNIALGGLTTLLIRNTGAPETLWHGFQPTFELGRIADSAGLRVSVEAGESSDTHTVTWDGSVTDLEKVRQLAEIAGHNPPWVDNNGILRSVSAARIYQAVLQFEKDIFFGEKSSVSVTNNYLAIPNRVIVTSNSSPGAQVVGVWNAPSSWPSSKARRGYVRTLIQDAPGVASNADAERVAATIGKRLSARRMTASILPTNLLDGPRVIEYDDAYWTVTRWDVSTAPGSEMNIEAEELFVDNNVVAVPLDFPGML